jgi:undecaprenyl-diphosphatase
MILLIGVADSITGIWYFWLKDRKQFFPLWLGFLITALLLYGISVLYYNDVINITVMMALFIGTAQGIALLPGISRLAATFFTGSILGLTPAIAFSFSLAIQLPLIVAAVAKVIYERKYTDLEKYLDWVNILLIMGASFVSYLAYGWVLGLFETHNTAWLACYMLIPMTLSILRRNNYF